MNANQRRNRRKKIQVTTHVKYLTDASDVKTTLGETIDLSTGGLQLKLPRLSEIEEIQELRIDLPGQSEQIVTDGEIRWRSAENGTGTVGIQFTSLSSSEQNQLAAYLELPHGDEIIKKGSLLRFQQLQQNLIHHYQPPPSVEERIEQLPPRQVYSITDLLDISPSELARFIADHLDVEYVSSLSRQEIQLLDLTESFCKSNNFAPIRDNRDHRVLVLSNPFKHLFFSIFNDYHNGEFTHFSITEPERINRLFEKSLEKKRTRNDEHQDIPGYLFVPNSDIQPDLQENLTLSNFSPEEVFQSQERYETSTRKTLIIRILNMVLTLAVDNGHSPLVLIPDGDTLELRFDEEERQHRELQFSHNIADLFITRLQIITNLSLTERRSKQQGQFHILLNEQKYRVDVSLVPIQTGQKALLHIKPE